MASEVLRDWLGEDRTGWPLINESYATRTPADRLDRTYTFQDPDRSLSGAPFRIDIVIAGDLVAEARPYVVIPELFARRYGEMQSANNFLALLATLGILGLMVAAMVALRRYARHGLVRWRPPLVVGSVVGILAGAAIVNGMSATWFTYDTATQAALHPVFVWVAAIAGGAATALLVCLTLASAEALTRQAFPWHADWWQLWRYRGTREVADQVLGGYTVAAIGFAYIATFYLVTRSLFGWWVPSELLDDPNQIATPLPWVAGIGMSLQAAVWEEALFRAVPLSLLSIAVAGRPDRERWIALGVVGTALLFGFGHANYPSWPPYSRGVEIFLEACLWAVLFLRFGILVPVLAHFFYDLVLFGLFATAGTAPEYRITAAVMLLTLAAPLLAVGWARLRQGGWLPLPDEARFGTWTPPPRPPIAPAPVVVAAPRVSERARRIALFTALAAALGVVLKPDAEVVGPVFSVPRERVLAVADSMLAGRGLNPSEWKQLAWTPPDTLDSFRSLLQEEAAESLAITLGSSYAIPKWWLVRYVRTTAAVAERAEEWRVRVLPDGRAFDVRHILPEGAPGSSLSPDSSRRIARLALIDAGIDPGVLMEIEYDETERAARRDVTVTYSDTTIGMPGGASARVWVSLAGDEPVSVRRAVDLPQAFLRTVRREEMTGMAVAGVLGMVAIGLIIWGIVRVSRQPLLVHDSLPRRTVFGLLGLLVVATLAESLQSWPTALAQYDTAMPWDRFVSTMVTMQFVGIVGVFLLMALWMLANGMRRRIGIPLAAATASPGEIAPDDLRLGFGFGGVIALLGLAADWVPSHEVPAGPATILDQAVPLLAQTPAALTTVAGIVPVAAIAVMSIAGLSPHPRQRLAGALVLLALIGAAGWAADTPWQAPDPLGLIGVAAVCWLLVQAVRHWGRVSVATWIFAALFVGLVGGAGDALRAASGVERLGALLGVVTSIALILATSVWLRRRSVFGDPAGTAARGPDENEIAKTTQHVE
jgi:hypothetical protein